MSRTWTEYKHKAKFTIKLPFTSTSEDGDTDADIKLIEEIEAKVGAILENYDGTIEYEDSEFIEETEEYNED